MTNYKITFKNLTDNQNTIEPQIKEFANREEAAEFAEEYIETSAPRYVWEPRHHYQDDFEYEAQWWYNNPLNCWSYDISEVQ